MSRDNECAIYHISGGRGSDGNPGDNGGEGVGPIANYHVNEDGILTNHNNILIGVLFSGGQPVDEPLKFKDGIFTELANVSQRTTGRKCSVIIRCIRTMHTVPSSDVNSHRSQIFAAIRSIRFQPCYAGPLLNRATLPYPIFVASLFVYGVKSLIARFALSTMLFIKLEAPMVFLRFDSGTGNLCQGLDATIQAAQKVATYLFEAALLGYVALSPHGELDLFESRPRPASAVTFPAFNHHQSSMHTCLHDAHRSGGGWIDLRYEEKLHKHSAWTPPESKVFNPNLSEREVELRHVEIMSAHPGISEIKIPPQLPEGGLEPKSGPPSGFPLPLKRLPCSLRCPTDAPPTLTNVAFAKLSCLISVIRRSISAEL
ncbi:hypothetical protein C8R47DRAFT_1290212 [Mycena vitilis]|nr:hypothetical protein C8R47DRAFT_1290212 [Mycena vitilis]